MLIIAQPEIIDPQLLAHGRRQRMTVRSEQLRYCIFRHLFLEDAIFIEIFIGINVMRLSRNGCGGIERQ